jgi:hypothetical protein
VVTQKTKQEASHPRGFLLRFFIKYGFIVSEKNMSPEEMLAEFKKFLTEKGLSLNAEVVPLLKDCWNAALRVQANVPVTITIGLPGTH